MKFRVVVAKRVNNMLKAWSFLESEMNSGSQRIEKALEEAIERLAFGADEIGESRIGNERILIVDPVSFICEVHPDSDTVIIYEAVIHHGRHP